MAHPAVDRRVTLDRRQGDHRPISGADASGPTLPAEDLWDARDVARHLKVSVSWVRQRVSANQIPFVRIGGWMVRFRPTDIRAFGASEFRGKVLTAKGASRG